MNNQDTSAKAAGNTSNKDGDKEFRFKQEFIDLYSELELNTLLDKIASKICDYTGCEEASIFLYDSIKEELYFHIATGKKQEMLKKLILKKGEGIVGWVAEHNESVVVNDCSNDSRFTNVADKKTNFVTQSLLAVPVSRDGKFLGVLESINKVDGEFDNDDRQLMEAIANFVSIPLQNAMLFNKVRSEIKDKEQLIELGKIVSRSFGLEDVFNALKNIITDIITPLEINVMVKSQGKTYKLLSNEDAPYKDQGIEETQMGSTHALYPLKTENKVLGLLELKISKKLPDEVVSLIRGVAIFAAISIDKFEMHARMLEKERIEKELQIARDIQQSFLLNEKVLLKGIDASFVNIPSSEVGGDYYDIVKLSDNETIFTINDISGHGVPASLLMAILRANFTYRIKKDNHVLTTIDYLNNLIAETTESNLYVTSFTYRLDRKSMKCNYINAGHNPPFLFRGDEVIELKEGATVLGMFPDIQRWEVELDIEEGDVLVLYTDGVIEAENPGGEQFSGERLKTLVLDSIRRGLDADSIREQLVVRLKEFVEKSHFEDDVTFVITRIVA
ncbi:MAG: SpoIIE family protein phosphatase [bacterium]|nr:SpoIIE family protein phosphatase [bacterium]